MDTTVYVIGPEGGPFKVGITTCLDRRLDQLQRASAYPIQLLHSATFPSRLARIVEKTLHKLLSDGHSHGEWFHFDYRTFEDLLAEAVIIASEPPRAGAPPPPNPEILDQTREALGLSSWQALADHLGVPIRRLHRWRDDGVPKCDQRLVQLACERLIQLHGKRAA